MHHEQEKVIRDFMEALVFYKISPSDPPNATRDPTPITTFFHLNFMT